MNRFHLHVACLLCLAPGVASAALSLQIGPNNGRDNVDIDVPPFGERFFDLIFHETGPVQREGAARPVDGYLDRVELHGDRP